MSQSFKIGNSIEIWTRKMVFEINKFKERVVTLDAIALMYILVVGGLCHILPIPEIVKGFLALPVFLIIPILIGKLLYFIPTFRKIFSDMDIVSLFVCSWLCGIIVILLISNVMYFLKIFHFIAFVVLILILILLSTMLSRVPTKSSFKDSRWVVNNKYIPMSLIVFALMPAIFIQNFTIFPIPINVTNYLHSTEILKIIDENIMPIINPYPHLPYVLFAIGASIFDTHPLHVMWWSIYLLYILFLCGTALFLYIVSKRKSVAIVGTFIGGWILQGGFVGHLYDPTPPFFISIMIFPYILYMLHKNIHIFRIYPKKTYSFLFITFFIFSIYFVLLTIIPLADSSKIFFLLLLSFVLFLYIFFTPIFLDNNDRFIFFILTLSMAYPIFTHTVHFYLYFFCICCYIFFSTLSGIMFNKKSTNILLLCFIIFVILFIGLQKLEVLNFEKLILDIPLLALKDTMWDLNFADKYHNLTSSTSSILFLIVLLGGLFLFFFLNNRKNIPVIVTYACIFLYFFPLFITYRILFLILPFFVYVIAYFVVFMYNTITNKNHPYFCSFIIVMLVVCLIPLLISSLSSYALGNAPFKNHIISVGTYEEYKVGIWIRENTTKKTFILSDPATQGMIIGYSNRKISDNVSITKGGRYNTIPLNAPIWQPLQHYIENVKEVFMENNLTTVYKNIKEITNGSDNVVIVISKRTLYWIENNYSDYNCQKSCMLYPYSKTDVPLYKIAYFKKFFNSPYFELIYNDEDKIYIFKVKNQSEQNQSAKY